jgi:hypothetical protein
MKKYIPLGLSKASRYARKDAKKSGVRIMLKGKNAIVTGSTSGIGLAIAQVLAGYSMVLVIKQSLISW